MLDVDKLDLDELIDALQDHSPEHSWWFDPATGEVEQWSEYFGDELGEGHPEERGLRFVDPTDSHEAWQDMADFAASVADPGVRGRLERALSGRGAFRRFRDELADQPALRSSWHALADARMMRRAAQWLADNELISEEAESELIAGHPDPPPPGAVTARAQLAAAVAQDLVEVFGARLDRVLLFGSSARGDTDPESDLDLLVVLAGDGDHWSDRAQMDDVLWRHTLRSGTVISALPVAARDLQAHRRPAMIRAVAEGVRVG